MTNIIITSMLVLGGAAAVNSLTGVNLHVAAFLIPIGIVIYTIIGGLKAIFIADYINTSFLFIVILIFVVGIYFIIQKLAALLAYMTDSYLPRLHNRWKEILTDHILHYLQLAD